MQIKFKKNIHALLLISLLFFQAYPFFHGHYDHEHGFEPCHHTVEAEGIVPCDHLHDHHSNVHKNSHDHHSNVHKDFHDHSKHCECTHKHFNGNWEFSKVNDSEYIINDETISDFRFSQELENYEIQNYQSPHFFLFIEFSIRTAAPPAFS